MVYSDCLFPDFIDTLIYELKSKHYMYSVGGVNDLAEILAYKFEDNENVKNIIVEFKEWMRESI